MCQTTHLKILVLVTFSDLTLTLTWAKYETISLVSTFAWSLGVHMESFGRNMLRLRSQRSATWTHPILTFGLSLTWHVTLILNFRKWFGSVSSRSFECRLVRLSTSIRFRDSRGGVGSDPPRLWWVQKQPRRWRVKFQSHLWALVAVACRRSWWHWRSSIWQSPSIRRWSPLFTTVLAKIHRQGGPGWTAETSPGLLLENMVSSYTCETSNRGRLPWGQPGRLATAGRLQYSGNTNGRNRRDQRLCRSRGCSRKRNSGDSGALAWQQRVVVPSSWWQDTRSTVTSRRCWLSVATRKRQWRSSWWPDWLSSGTWISVHGALWVYHRAPCTVVGSMSLGQQ